MVKSCNFIEIEEACNHLWVTTEELKTILGGVSKAKADKFRMNLEQILDKEYTASLEEKDETKRIKMQSQCFYYKDTRPHKLPIKRVLEYTHIDLDYVRREANKMRKAKNIEIIGNGGYQNENNEKNVQRV